MKKRVSITIPAVGIVFFSQFSTADTVIGRWCDRMIPGMPKYNHIMEIVIDNNGESILKSKFGDGSSIESELKEISGGMYAKVDSHSGDKYRIVSSSGELQLLDKDGIIRVATRLENKATSGECAR